MMAEYVVTRTFVDLQDNKHRYVVGDTYPREGATSGKKRIQELLSPNNRLGVAVISKVQEKASPLPSLGSEVGETGENKPKATKAKKKAKKG